MKKKIKQISRPARKAFAARACRNNSYRPVFRNASSYPQYWDFIV